jgi:alpha-beta hydrolase superfamily lysophospholipase
MGWAFRQRRVGVACPFARILLLAPLVRPAEWAKVQLMHATLKYFRRSITRRFMENSGDAEFLAFLQQDPLQSQRLPVAWVGAMRRWVQGFVAEIPTDYAPLVIQGDHDTTVDWRWNLPQIRTKFPRATVRMIQGARHQLVNETPALRAQIFDALEL